MATPPWSVATARNPFRSGNTPVTRWAHISSFNSGDEIDSGSRPRVLNP